jgi:hypothetical protein
VRILLDESLPRTLAASLAGHDVETVSVVLPYGRLLRDA